MKKLCVLFPGIGYHCDKPLLYYCARLARSRGYEVRPLGFDGFPTGAKGNDEKMRQAALHALRQSEEQLSAVSFPEYGRVVFIGKSIGTYAALAVNSRLGANACGVLLTPLALTFEQSASGFIALHGTADPWAATGEIKRLCSERGVPLYTYENADHSLETGDTFSDIKNLSDIMEKCGKIIL